MHNSLKKLGWGSALLGLVLTTATLLHGRQLKMTNSSRMIRRAAWLAWDIWKVPSHSNPPANRIGLAP